GPSPALQPADALIRIDAYYQHIPQLTGAVQVTYMAAVQYIETAVGENDLLAPGPVYVADTGQLLQVSDIFLAGGEIGKELFLAATGGVGLADSHFRGSAGYFRG